MKSTMGKIEQERKTVSVSVCVCVCAILNRVSKLNKNSEITC